MLDAANQPWVLEVNTVPGLTGRSLAPQAAERAGITMPALCTWMIHDCLIAGDGRMSGRAKRKKSIETSAAIQIGGRGVSLVAARSERFAAA